MMGLLTQGRPGWCTLAVTVLVTTAMMVKSTLGGTSTGYFFEIEGVIPRGIVQAVKMVSTGLECSAVCVSVGCQVYTLKGITKGQLCTALSNVYRLQYVPLDSTFRIYTTQERLSALTTTTTTTSTSTTTTSTTTTSTTTPLPPCLNIAVATNDFILEDAPNTLTVNQNNYYVFNGDYSWRIIVQPGFRVVLNWIFFSTEDVYDIVSVSDPCTAEGYYVWHEYTGTNVPPASMSSRNEVLIKFFSDGVVLAEGFTVEYAAVG